MKKISFIVFSALLLAACSNTKIQINGTLPQSLDLNGEYVELVVNQQGEKQVVDATISNGKFSFSLSDVEPQLSKVKIGGLEGSYTICLEPGVINFSVESKTDDEGDEYWQVLCTGTPSNDIICQYLKDEYELNKQIEDFYNSATDEDDTEATANIFHDAGLLYETFINQHFDLASKQPQLLGNQYVIKELYYDLSDEQKAALFDALTDEDKQSESWHSLFVNYSAQQATAVGMQYVDIEAVTLDGQVAHLSDYVGKTQYLLVDFWATWCGPCRQLLPELKKVYDANRSRLQIVGVSVDKDANEWKKFVDNNQYDWVQLNDTKDESDKYGVIYIPTTILIDNDGVIVARNVHAEELNAILAN